MKLTGIAIEGYRKLNNVHLMQISPSMNMVYGEKGAGKTRIADFISEILFGQTNDANRSQVRSSINTNEPTQGKLDVGNSYGKFTLTRDSRTGQLDVTGADHSVQNSSDLQHLVSGSIDADLYRNFFNVAFDTRSSAHSGSSNPTLADTLHRRLGVGVGPGSGGINSVSPQQSQLSKSLQLEIETVNGRIAVLQQKSQQLNSQIAAGSSSATARASQLDQQIADIERRIVALTANPNQQELSLITAEIDQLKLRISSAASTFVAPAPQVNNNSALLYEQLDEIDTQLIRWQSVQNDVQQQRVQLKDEMVMWNEMTLESEHHPYHKARETLLNLEKRVDHAESQTAQWLDSHGPIDSHQAAGFVNDVCKGMRSDLYNLCDELGKQYKQIRHRSAAAELKRLRRCYEEITENVTRLIQRRRSVIEQIRLADPAGADAIVRADQKFCQCAAHEGYLKARERFLGPIAPVASAAQIAAPDLTTQRNRLMLLENRRTELQRHGSSNSLEMTQLRSQVMNLRNERASLTVSDDSAWKLELSRIESELQTNLATLQSLNVRLEQSLRQPQSTPHPLLTEASQTLSRLSHGDLSRVWLVNNAGRTDIQVQDNHQRVLHLAALSSTMRAQTELALILSANQILVAQGVTAPLIVDELFEDFDSDRIDTALQVIAEFSSRGHQVIMLTQHRFLIDRANNYGTIKFYDIESQTTHAATHFSANYAAPAPTHSIVSPATIAFSTANTFTPTAEPTPLPRPTATPPPSPVVEQYYPAPQPESRTPAVNHFNRAQPRTSSASAFGSPPNVASIKANQIGDRLEYAVTFEEHSQLSEIPIFDSLQLRTLSESGIDSVADLLNVDVERLPQHWSEAGLTRTVVDNMQSEIWLLTCVPALRPYDAHVLVACGIFEPDQLETSAAQILLERVQRYLNANEAEHEFDDSYRITINRINDWHKGIAKTRNRWRNRRENRNNRNLRGDLNGDRNRTTSQRPRENGRAEHNGSRQIESQVNRSNGPRLSRYSDRDSASERNGHVSGSQRSFSRTTQKSDRGFEERTSDRAANIIRADRSFSRSNNDNNSRDAQPQSNRTPRMATPTPETFRRSVPAMAPESSRVRETKPAAMRTTPKSTKSTHKFYLDLEDHIEAAPSIGPKTAERFEKIGVFTIAEFLKQTAESMSSKLNYKRMSVDVVRSWQQQARLVCRIPNLRGHDAQLLVACEIFEPEEIASMQPQSLFRIIEPFSETKEGLKIIRSGKKPDLAEITDWIAWAQHTRSLQAA